MTSLGQHLLHAVTKKNSNKQLQNNEKLFFLLTIIFFLTFKIVFY